jgi:hypothetical protein
MCEYFLILFTKSITHLIDIKAIPTNTALTASLRPAYSNACGSISYSVRKAITPPTVKKKEKKYQLSEYFQLIERNGFYIVITVT